MRYLLLNLLQPSWGYVGFAAWVISLIGLILIVQTVWFNAFKSLLKSCEELVIVLGLFSSAWFDIVCKIPCKIVSILKSCNPIQSWHALPEWSESLLLV